MNSSEVIEGLERCLKYLCDDCTLEGASHYPLDCVVQDHFVQEAVRLLKENQPVKVFRLDNVQEVNLTGVLCSNCGGDLMEHWKACPICGRKLNWDETN